MHTLVNNYLFDIYFKYTWKIFYFKIENLIKKRVWRRNLPTTVRIGYQILELFFFFVKRELFLNAKS